ncbi:hypothetical protein BH10BAC5_BH10BAC5_13090 [soil metagenome]
MTRNLRFAGITLMMLAFSSLIFAAVNIQYFTAKNVSDGVLIEWKTLDEGGVTKYELERSMNTPDNFLYVNTVSANGNNSYYSYTDNSVTTRGATLYYYRLKCKDANGNYTYSNSITVSHIISGIRSTWGSIKAIFR